MTMSKNTTQLSLAGAGSIVPHRTRSACSLSLGAVGLLKCFRFDVLSNTLITYCPRNVPATLSQHLAGAMSAGVRGNSWGGSLCRRCVEVKTQRLRPCIHHWKVRQGKATQSKRVVAGLNVSWIPMDVGTASVAKCNHCDQQCDVMHALVWFITLINSKCG